MVGKLILFMAAINIYIYYMYIYIYISFNQVGWKSFELFNLPDIFCDILHGFTLSATSWCCNLSFLVPWGFRPIRGNIIKGSPDSSQQGQQYQGEFSQQGQQYQGESSHQGQQYKGSPVSRGYHPKGVQSAGATISRASFQSGLLYQENPQGYSPQG